MVYDEVMGNIPRHVYVDWDTPGQNVHGVVLNVRPVRDPYPSVKVSIRMDDGTIATFFALTDLKGKIHLENEGQYADITYLRERKLNGHTLKQFRVLLEVKYRKPPKKNGKKK